MSDYDKAMAVMDELFGKDRFFAFATAKDNVPSVRFLDTFYQNGAFYIVTFARSQKVQELEQNSNVAMCYQAYRFSGKARNIGHPLKPENAELRKKLIEVFEPWYFAHNNEDDPTMCYVKVEPQMGFIYKDGTGYKVDFAGKTAESFPFDFDETPL